MLLHFLHWLRSNSDIDLMVLLREGGELEGEFASLGVTYRFDGRRVHRTRTMTRLVSAVHRFALRRGPESRKSRLLRMLCENKPDLIYSNTITNGLVLEWLSCLKVPAVTHVHEMGTWIQSYGEENLNLVKKNSIAYVAASHAVKRALVNDWLFDPDRIHVVHEFISSNVERVKKESIDTVRRELGVSKDATLIVGSGIETRRKGKDLFMDLAERVTEHSHGADVHFLWVGAWEHEEHKAQFEERLRQDGLEDTVHFIGQVDNPLDYFAASDVFVLTSREDPYPLVCLEAALVGLPILCFADAGGMPEFVEEDAGLVCNYLDVEQMVQGVLDLVADSGRRSAIGDCTRLKVLSRHEVGVAAPRLLSVLQQYLHKA